MFLTHSHFKTISQIQTKRKMARTRGQQFTVAKLDLTLPHQEFTALVREHRDDQGEIVIHDRFRCVSLVVNKWLQTPTYTSDCIANIVHLFALLPSSFTLFNDVSTGHYVNEQDGQPGHVAPWSFVTPLTKLLDNIQDEFHRNLFAPVFQMMISKGAFYQTTYSRLISFVVDKVDFLKFPPHTQDQLRTIQLENYKEKFYQLFTSKSVGCFLNVEDPLGYELVNVLVQNDLVKKVPFDCSITREPSHEQRYVNPQLRKVYGTTMDMTPPNRITAQTVPPPVQKRRRQDDTKEEPNPESVLFGPRLPSPVGEEEEDGPRVPLQQDGPPVQRLLFNPEDGPSTQ